MENLTEKLDTYLLNWWCALPLEAIMEIHMTDRDLNDIDDDKEFQDEIDVIRDEWHNDFDLEDRIAYHDDLYNKYYEFTKHITL